MPYRNSVEKRGYNIGYRAGWRAATIHFLGNKCMWEGCDVSGPRRLEIHHPKGRRGDPKGTGPKDWTDLSELEVYCKQHHKIIDKERTQLGEWGVVTAFMWLFEETEN